MAHKKNNRIPKSKAKTAYGLLSEVAALALAEPKRLVMGTWCVTAAPYTSVPAQSCFYHRRVTMPVCGTVGCIGGWTETLRSDAKQSARELLGLTYAQNERLFFNRKLMLASEQQTPEHARATVKHIRRFQKRYRKQLLAKKLS